MSDPTGLILGAAAIGAGGAIAAQVVGGFITARRDTYRLNFDQNAQQLDGARRKYELLFESKRLVFSRAYKLAQERYVQMQDLTITEWKEGQTWHTASNEWFEAWREARAEIVLLDETLDPLMRALLNDFFQWASEIGYDYIGNAMTRSLAIENSMGSLANKMRESLGT